MNVRNAYYWPVALVDDQLADTYQLVECTGVAGQHRLMVPKSWACLSPVPQRPEPDAPTVVSLFVEDLEMGDDAATVAVVALPKNAAFFASEIVTHLARLDGLEVMELDPSGAVDLRASAAGRGRMAFYSVDLKSEQWLCLVGVGPAAREEAVGQPLRTAWLTFQTQNPADLHDV